MGLDMGDKGAAVESSISTQEGALGEEIAALYALLAERKDALNQVTFGFSLGPFNCSW
jgi:hypothetical protein